MTTDPSEQFHRSVEARLREQLTVDWRFCETLLEPFLQMLRGEIKQSERKGMALCPTEDDFDMSVHIVTSELMPVLDGPEVKLSELLWNDEPTEEGRADMIIALDKMLAQLQQRFDAKYGRAIFETGETEA